MNLACLQDAKFEFQRGQRVYQVVKYDSRTNQASDKLNQ